MAEKTNYVKISVLYDEKKIAISSVDFTVLDDRMILRGENFDLIPHQSIVDVVGYSEKGVLVMCGKVTLSTRMQVNIDIIKSDDLQDRRKYLKVKTSKKGRVVQAFSMGKSKKPYDIDERIETRDISLGGVCFYSNKTFLKKQKISLEFDFLRLGRNLEAEVLRRVKGEFRGSYRYKYGCRFLKINYKEEQVICEYVFRVQLENHKRLKEDEEY